MKKLLVTLFATFGITACSTTNSSNLTSTQASAQPSDQVVCFYTKGIGSYIKQNRCMNKKAYYNLYAVSFMPSQPSKPTYVDQLPNTGK